MPKSRHRPVSAAADLVAHAPFGMLRVDPDGTILEANPAMARLVGIAKAADLVGRHLGRDLLADPGDLPRLLAAFAATPGVAERSACRHRDGTVVLVGISGRRLTPPSGEPAFDCWTEDLEASRVAQRRFEAVVEHAIDNITLLSPDGQVVWSSPGVRRTLGYQPGEATGASLRQFVHPDDLAEAGRRFAAVASTPGAVDRLSFRALRKDGVPLDVEAIAVNRLDHPLIRAIVVTLWEVTERVRAERQLRHSEAYYRAILDQAADAIFVLDQNGDVVTANRRASEMFGYSPEEILSIPVQSTYVPEDRNQVEPRLERLRAGEMLQYERLALRKDGSSFPVEITARMLDDGRIQSIVRDISGRHLLEEQLRQSSKMEAVGQLAGGIAHDFNNLLTAILGSCEFLLADTGLPAPHRRDIEEIENAARRAATLTRQLLAFSRKQVLQPERLPLNAVVTGLEPLLRRLLGEHIAIRTGLADGLPDVRIDKSQLEQVIINLAVNARDAMPRGGTLTIATQETELDAAYAESHPEVQPGHYAALVVSDDGIGMDAAIRARIFEPFFTTKAAGFGTGLGLATVYGIVKQSNGHIGVYSEPGRGTTFRIYLPPAPGTGERTSGPRRAASGAARRGDETVLLVEDEARVRGLARRVLEGLGYRVLDAADGREALALGEGYTGPIHLLFTDVVMPGMGGRELAERLAYAHPEMRIIYTSGYATDGIVSDGVLDPGVDYLAKPYSADALGRKVREVLDLTS
jgi:two-component system cell cycle sensor histidine kinase/response regulator CckA